MDIKFLKYLKDNSLGWVNVLSYFRTEHQKDFDSYVLRIKLLLDDLSELGFIQFPEKNPEYGKLKDMTFDEYEKAHGYIKCLITLKGRIFLMDKNREKRQGKINEKQRKINRTISIFTAILMGTSIFMVGIEIYKLYKEGKESYCKHKCNLHSKESSCQTNADTTKIFSCR